MFYLWRRCISHNVAAQWQINLIYSSVFLRGKKIHICIILYDYKYIRYMTGLICAHSFIYLFLIFFPTGQVAPWMTTTCVTPMWRWLFVCDQWTGEVRIMSHKPCDRQSLSVVMSWTIWLLISLGFMGQTKAVFFFFFKQLCPAPKGFINPDRQHICAVCETGANLLFSMNNRAFSPQS